MNNTRNLGAELLNDLADKVAAQIIERTALPEDDAMQIARDVAGSVADDWGGQSLYIPMNLGARRADRNAEIFKRFKGNNLFDLVQEFGLSDSCIRRIIKDETARRRTPQGSLF